MGPVNNHQWLNVSLEEELNASDCNSRKIFLHGPFAQFFHLLPLVVLLMTSLFKASQSIFFVHCWTNFVTNAMILFSLFLLLLFLQSLIEQATIPIGLDNIGNKLFLNFRIIHAKFRYCFNNIPRILILPQKCRTLEQSFHLIFLIKDTLKAFNNFKNKQKSVWINFFWYVKVCTFRKCTTYTIHSNKTKMLKKFPLDKINGTKKCPLFPFVSSNSWQFYI